jgi:hypothetical protein
VGNHEAASIVKRDSRSPIVGNLSEFDLLVARTAVDPQELPDQHERYRATANHDSPPSDGRANEAIVSIDRTTQTDARGVVSYQQNPARHDRDTDWHHPDRIADSDLLEFCDFVQSDRLLIASYDAVRHHSWIVKRDPFCTFPCAGKSATSIAV